jgi:hypothetical protein
MDVGVAERLPGCSPTLHGPGDEETKGSLASLGMTPPGGERGFQQEQIQDRRFQRDDIPKPKTDPSSARKMGGLGMTAMEPKAAERLFATLRMTE